MTDKEINRQTGLSLFSIGKIWKEKFGGKTNFLYSYRRERTIELLREGWDITDIYEIEFGFDNFGDNGERDFKKWFPELTIDQIIQFYAP